jgi:hypothetical protein
MNPSDQSDQTPNRQPMAHHRWLPLVLELALIHGMVYAAIVPPWQAPDEPGHLEYVWLLIHLGRLSAPTDSDPRFEQELIASLYEWRYGAFIGRPLPARMPARIDQLPEGVFAQFARPVVSGRFSLAYVWQALFLLPFQEQDLALQLLIVRLSSVLLNVAIVWLAFLTFGELLPARPDLAVLATMFIVFLPQHTFVNSSVSDGPLAEAMACLVLYGWATLFRRGVRAWPLVGIVLGTLIGLWSKSTAAYLIPIDIALAGGWLVRQRHRPWKWQYWAYLGACIVLMSVALWIWVHSSLGQRALPWLKTLPSLSKWIWADQRGTTLGQALLAAYDSLWANFGWLSLPIGARWYGAIALLTSMAFWGWCFGKRQEPQVEPRWPSGIMGGALIAALLIFLWAGLFSQPGSYQFQGRYLFPALIPVAFLLVGGLDRLLHLQSNRATLLAVVLFLVVLDSWCLFAVIIPYYYA